MDFSRIVAELGLPIGLIVLGVYCAGRSARFFAPLVTMVAEKHCELIDTLKEHSSKQTEIMESQNDALAEHGLLLREIHSAIHDEDEDDNGTNG